MLFLLPTPLDHILFTDLNMNSEQRTAEQHLWFFSFSPCWAFHVSSAEKLPFRKRECNDIVVFLLRLIVWVAQFMVACINLWRLVLVASLAKEKKWCCLLPKGQPCILFLLQKQNKQAWLSKAHCLTLTVQHLLPYPFCSLSLPQHKLVQTQSFGQQNQVFYSVNQSWISLI